MDYGSAKKNFSEIVSDFKRHPIRTGIILSIILFLVIGYSAISTYVSNWVTNRSGIPPQETQILSNMNLHNVSVSTESIQEETDTYSLKVDYPVFSISELDTRIKEIIENQILIFKKHTGRPELQNQFLGTVSSVYIDNDIISFKLERYEYLGGVHGMDFTVGINYDQKSGRFLTLEDALTMTGKNLYQVADIAKKQLKEKFGEISWEDGVLPKPENFSIFIINKEAIIFVFEEYQVVPRVVEKMPEVSIPRIK